MRTAAVVVLAALAVLSVAGCDQKPASLDDFIDLDAQGKPIVCADLVATYDTYGDSQPRFSDERFKPLIVEATDRGVTFKQCRAEIAVERHDRCVQYAAAVRAGITQPKPKDDALASPIWFVRGHLPDDLTAACSAEVRAAVAGINDEFHTETGGPNPILDLTRESASIPMSNITRLSLDPRDAADSLWRIDVDASDGSYSLWFSSSEKANAAYDALRAAWVQARPTGNSRRS